MKPNKREQLERASGRPTRIAWQQMNRKQRREWTRKRQAEKISLQVMDPDAAGIDIGNEAQCVAVPPTAAYTQPLSPKVHAHGDCSSASSHIVRLLDDRLTANF